MRCFQGLEIARGLPHERKTTMKKMMIMALVAMVTVLVFGACANPSLVMVADTVDATDGDQATQNSTTTIEVEVIACHQNTDCNDGIACTWDTCNRCTGECSHELEDSYCANQPGHECQIGTCSPDSVYADQKGCAWTQLDEGAVCNDDNTCTVQDVCTADGQCVGENVKIGDVEFCSLCESDDDCVESIECIDGHIWGIQYLGVCQSDGTCATLIVAENSADPEVAAVWVANCKQ